MYKIISDSGCDFSKEEALSSDVTIIPFYVSFDGETYLKQGVDVSTEEYFNRLISDKNLFPKTSQPNPQDYIDVFTPHLESGNDIIMLTISSKLSGSYQSATMAIDMLSEDYPDRTIALIDSLSASVGQGVILRELVKMRNAGYPLGQAVKCAEEVRSTTHVYFTVENLEYLRRGGRVGPTTALVGGILGLSPILQLENGEVSQLDNVRGKKRALELIEEAMVYALKDDIENINISIGHVMCRAEADTVGNNTEKALSIKLPHAATDIGIAIGTHAGPGAIAFAYCKKFEAVASAGIEKQEAA